MRLQKTLWDRDFPGSPVVKTACFYCKGCRFDLLVGKIPWRRAWQPTTVLLPWRIPWIEEPGRLQSMGHTVSHN